MQTTSLRQKLHQFIDTIEDKKAEAIYTLFEDEINSDDQRLKMIREEREKYLRGDGKSYSWDEVKEMALNKNKRDGL